jgi:hypothetical protein
MRLSARGDIPRYAAPQHVAVRQDVRPRFPRLIRVPYPRARWAASTTASKASRVEAWRGG